METVNSELIVGLFSTSMVLHGAPRCQFRWALSRLAYPHTLGGLHSGIEEPEGEEFQ